MMSMDMMSDGWRDNNVGSSTCENCYFDNKKLLLRQIINEKEARIKSREFRSVGLSSPLRPGRFLFSCAASIKLPSWAI